MNNIDKLVNMLVFRVPERVREKELDMMRRSKPALHRAVLQKLRLLKEKVS